MLAVARDGHADAGGDQAIRLGRGALAHHDVDDLAGLELLQPLLDRDLLAVGREDAGDPDEVVAGDPGVAEGQLEAGQFLAMGAHPLGEEQLAWVRTSVA